MRLANGWFCLLLLMPASSCEESAVASETVADSEPSPEEVVLRAQINELSNAMLDGDWETQANYGHPALVELLGGRQAYIKMMKGVAKEMGSGGFVPSRVELKTVSDIVASGDKKFATVRFELQLDGPKEAVGLIDSYFIAESPGTEDRWTFLDGSGIKQNRSQLLTVVPEFPADLELPKLGDPIWK